MAGPEHAVAQRIALLSPHLTERQRRLLLGSEAKTLGRGGVSTVARVARASRATIQRALRDLEQPPLEAQPPVRSRRAGGGRKRLTVKDPDLLTDLELMVEPATRGDPESPLRWTSKSTRQLAAALQEQGHLVGHVAVGELLRELGYSLQANVKTMEGRQHPDRDAQFRYLDQQVRRYLRAGDPVVSVDTKKKELVGQFKNAGREWQPSGDPEWVKIHDFIDPKHGKAIPYGIYDVGRNLGWVSVGSDHDTASFAVESLRRWWRAMGQSLYPKSRRILICADSGGSNGYRVRLWKLELGRWASETGLQITVCHLPPGTSKWNRIEHRLFAHISMNWRGRPLTSHEVIVELIGATTTQTGLQVHAEKDAGTYPSAVKVSTAELAAVPIQEHKFHGDWNYSVRP